MPAAYSGKHPTYDLANPATATRFFDGVELAAKVAGLTDHDEEVVEHALTYLKPQTARLWKRLEGGSAPFNFAKWRKAVMKILPKASRYDVGSMARLDDLCRKARERPIGRDEKSAFYEFALVVKFIAGLKGVFREGLSERLSRKTPVADADGAVRDEEDPFTLDEVIKFATEMVDAAAVGPFGSLAYVEEEADYARNVTSSGLSDRAELAGLKDLKIKQESMAEEMAKVYTTLDRVEKSMSLLTTKFNTFTARMAPAPAQAPYRPSNQASMEQMKKEQNAFLNRISQQLRPAQPAAPKIEPPKEVSTREVLEQLCELSKRFDNVEQFQLQTRWAAASGNQEDF
ncbi:hypothetical protein EST38_g12067 [Candolleomyces aberdarensis]|uniref:Uncharacterized protein n=1 Tax=Candolleomyces aberdarensis TaxID=2316362 RepID=A0A4Q2D3B9_9AGAR|nr:hypothetical protein EST38_g12067 [Candolleomyces aberdarensis]